MQVNGREIRRTGRLACFAVDSSLALPRRKVCKPLAEREPPIGLGIRPVPEMHYAENDCHHPER